MLNTMHRDQHNWEQRIYTYLHLLKNQKSTMYNNYRNNFGAALIDKDCLKKPILYCIA